MKIKVTTTINAIEKINLILANIPEQIIRQELPNKFYGLNNNDLKQIESFRKSMLRSFLKIKTQP